MSAGRLRATAVVAVVAAAAVGIGWVAGARPTHAAGAAAALVSPGDGTLVIAHRGGAELAPENSLAAMAAAVASGAGLAEFDVRLSADGVPVLMHDETVDRTTDGTGAVAALTAEELAALGVPTLGEALAVLAPARTGAMIELKGGWSEEQVALVARLVDDAGMGERALVASFDLGALQAARQAAPGLPRILLTGDLGDVEPAVGLTGAAAVGVSPETLARDPDAPRRLAELGVGLLLYTLDTPGEWAAALASGARGIITDAPSRALAWLGD